MAPCLQPHVGANEAVYHDVGKATATINSILENIVARLENDKLLREALDFTVRRKSVGRWTKVYEYQGPDLETATILNQNRDAWTQYPQLFSSICLKPIGSVRHPLVYAAGQCLWWEQHDAWTTMIKRAHCVNLSRVQKEYDMNPEDLADLLRPNFSQYSRDDLIKKIKQLLKDGSMLES